MKKLCSLILVVFLTGSAYAQTISKKEAAELQRIVYYFFREGRNEHSKHMTTETKAEGFFIFLDIDSTGKVEKVYLLSDYLNRDSAFERMKKLTARDFENCLMEKAAGKSILIPFMVLANNDPRYVKRITKKSLPFGERGDLVIIEPVITTWPIKVAY